MDLIKIIWIDSVCKVERASFEMAAGDMAEASRIFAEMVDCLNLEKSAVREKNLSPGLPEVERKAGS